jgi:hypothetical protein
MARERLASQLELARYMTELKPKLSSFKNSNESSRPELLTSKFEGVCELRVFRPPLTTCHPQIAHELGRQGPYGVAHMNALSSHRLGWMGSSYHLSMPTRSTHQLFLKPQLWQSSDQIEFTQARQKVEAQVTQLPMPLPQLTRKTSQEPTPKNHIPKKIVSWLCAHMRLPGSFTQRTRKIDTSTILATSGCSELCMTTSTTCLD